MKKNLLCSLAILAAIHLAGSRGWAADGLNEKVNHALDFAQKQARKTILQLNDPAVSVRSTTPEGTWKTIKPEDWTSGFFPGELWLLEADSKSPDFLKWAEEWTASLESQKNNTGDHDVGFRIFCSYGNGYRRTFKSEYRDVILAAARSLATRFNPQVGCLRSWSWGTWSFPVIVDNMMNLEMLFWASKNGGDSAWYEMAVKHALTTQKNHIRPDGGTYHVVDYDPRTGAILKKMTHQGLRDDSTWARGQAWAIYGFTVAYRETGDRQFLATAQKVARYFISHLPEDHVPYWDFQAEAAAKTPRDSSAAAIAASALLELSSLSRLSTEKQEFREVALSILKSLCSPVYLAEGTNMSCLLQHATGSKPQDSEVDVGIIYGDYYFLEALLRYKNPLQIPKPTAKPRAVTSTSSAKILVTAENPIAMERNQETISLAWMDLLHVQPALKSQRLEVIDNDSGKPLVSQSIDLDLNGTPDEFIFQAPFKSGQTKTFAIQSSHRDPNTGIEPKVFAMFAKEREDLAWENDRIAFRMYGPWLRKELISSGVDVWVKKVSYPVIEKWYAPGYNYHVDTGEGLDFYSVGPSRGCGGTAIWKNDQMFPSDNFASYRIIAQGPIRVMFELHYDPWDAGGVKFSEIKRISLDAGQNLSRHEVIYSCEPRQEEIQEVIGLLQHGGTHVANDKDYSWLAVWGSPDKSKNGELGTGVVIDKKRLIRFTDVKDQHLAITYANPGRPAVHYAGAGWSKSGSFSNAADWYAYIDKFAQKLNSPIKISLSKPQ
jgi:unsaturated chondroitin disaccharide hydrolase